MCMGAPPTPCQSQCISTSTTQVLHLVGKHSDRAERRGGVVEITIKNRISRRSGSMAHSKFQATPLVGHWHRTFAVQQKRVSSAPPKWGFGEDGRWPMTRKILGRLVATCSLQGILLSQLGISSPGTSRGWPITMGLVGEWSVGRPRVTMLTRGPFVTCHARSPGKGNFRVGKINRAFSQIKVLQK